MANKPLTQVERIKRFDNIIRSQAGKVVRPYRADGFVNLLNKYGTQRDTSERYEFQREGDVPDSLMVEFYEGNGLFAKIIDAPADEAIVSGFKLSGVEDKDIEDFYQEALDDLDWDEVSSTCIKWARLFGGCIAVMFINDGRGLEEPVDWKNIESIDGIQIYDRSVVQPDYQSMYKYEHKDPFTSRGVALGTPERFFVTSKYGSFTVHESRCLIFKNGKLPENTTNTNYEIWGIPEYLRIKRAIKDAEVAHSTAPKMLDRSVQAVYSMRGLAEALSTEEGEGLVLKRLQTIDMARGLLNSITIDSEGEDYGFRQFTYSGVSEVIDTTCNFLSAITSIPQTILFGRSPAGMNSTGQSDLENWYKYVGRIQKRMLKKNIRYLLSIIFQAGVNAGDIDEVPNIDIEFNPLWSMSDVEKADLDMKKEQIKLTKAQIASTYVDMQVLDPTEVRKKLADSDEFDIDTILDEYSDEELFPEQPQGGDMMSMMGGQNPMGGQMPMGGQNPEAEGLNPVADIQGHDTPENVGGNVSSPNALKGEESPKVMDDDIKPTAEELELGQIINEKIAEKEEIMATPEEMKIAQEINERLSQEENTDSQEPLSRFDAEDSKTKAVGIVVVKNGKFLVATRNTDYYKGFISSAGGHCKIGETPRESAMRETEEEFGVKPVDLIYIGKGSEDENGTTPYMYLCTDYENNVKCKDREMARPRFVSMEYLKKNSDKLFRPYVEAVNKSLETIGYPDDFRIDGNNNLVKMAFIKAKLLGIDTTGMTLDEVFEAIKNADGTDKDGLISMFKGKNLDKEKKSADKAYKKIKEEEKANIEKAKKQAEEESTRIEEEKKRLENEKVEKDCQDRLNTIHSNKMSTEVLTSQHNYDRLSKSFKEVEVSETGVNKSSLGFGYRNIKKGDEVKFVDELTNHYNKHVIERQEPILKDMTPKQMEDYAVDMLMKPVEGDVLGFKGSDSNGDYVVRFDKSTGMFAKGYPNGYVATIFVAKYRPQDNGDAYPDYLDRAYNYYLSELEDAKRGN